MMELDVDAPPEGCTILEAVVLTRMLDENGEVVFGFFTTSGMYKPEAIGLMTLQIAEGVKDWCEG